MISKEEVLQLAALARLDLKEGEVENLQKEISTILDYVGQVSAVQTAPSDTKPLLRNVVREDVATEVLGKRDSLVAAFPVHEGNYNVVRKIIQKDE